MATVFLTGFFIGVVVTLGGILLIISSPKDKNKD